MKIGRESGQQKRVFLKDRKSAKNQPKISQNTAKISQKLQK